MDASRTNDLNSEPTGVVMRNRFETTNSQQSYKIDRNKRKIEELKKMAQLKISALSAIKSNVYRQETDNRVIEKLEIDIKNIKQDLNLFTTHVRKTQEYISNMGNWRTHVLKAIPFDEKNLSNESNNDQTTLFEIQVQLFDEGLDPEKQTENDAKEGWVIYRSHKQFLALYESLNEISPVNITSQFKKFPKLKRQLSKTISDDKLKNCLEIFDSYLKVYNI